VAVAADSTTTVSTDLQWPSPPAPQSIEGTVTNNTVPVSGAVVSFFGATSDAFVSSVLSDSNGHYQSVGLPAGTYHVRFVPSVPSTLTQFYDHQTLISRATTVTLAGGHNTVVSSDLKWPTPAVVPSIEGTITNNSAPVSGAVVSFYAAGATADTYVSGVFTDAQGHYKSAALPLGTYHVRFTNVTPSSFNQYYDHKTIITQASTVTVSAGQVTGVSSDLKWPTVISQSIEGTITYYGVPQERIVVSAFDATTHAYVTGVFTNAQGFYKLINLPIGYYHLRFTSTNPAYLAQFWDHQFMPMEYISQATTTPLVGYNQTKQISTDLSPWLTISGDLTVNGAPPQYKIVVQAFNSTTGLFVKSVFADPVTGHYVLDKLNPGGYRVRFTPQAFDKVDGPDQYWARKSTFTAADIIMVPPVDYQPWQYFTASSELSTPTVWP
jgi:hypothetical protein